MQEQIEFFCELVLDWENHAQIFFHLLYCDHSDCQSDSVTDPESDQTDLPLPFLHF